MKNWRVRLLTLLASVAMLLAVSGGPAMAQVFFDELVCYDEVVFWDSDPDEILWDPDRNIWWYCWRVDGDVATADFVGTGFLSEGYAEEFDDVFDAGFDAGQEAEEAKQEADDDDDDDDFGDVGLAANDSFFEDDDDDDDDDDFDDD